MSAACIPPRVSRLPISLSSMKFIRAVHYFGRAQPVNFWDAARLKDVPDDFRRIKEDGFNAVILVIPWRGFQRGLFPSTFDESNLRKLQEILRLIDTHDLGCILRVSFPWNHDPDSELTFDQRILGLFSSSQIRAAWLSYLRELRAKADQSRRFLFAFFSWEDLPSIRPLMAYRSKEERLALAGPIGFHGFLRSRLDLREVSEFYGEEFADFSEVYIPLADGRAFSLYNDFVNQALSDLLSDGRHVWPQLSMQVRVDLEQIRMGDAVSYIENDVRAWDRTIRVTYYFPYMYAWNRGERLSCDDALANLTRVLNKVTADGSNINHFLDQFVFYDESPQFQDWASIDPRELPRFLQEAGCLLRRMSRGYGLWNYWDYRHNHLYNPCFLKGLHGWTVYGDVVLRTEAPEEHWAVLPRKSAISQRMIPDQAGNATERYLNVRFTAKVNCKGNAGRLVIRTNGVIECENSLDASQTTILADLRPELHSGNQTVEFCIENHGENDVEISDLCLWGFVFRSHIYDEHGHPGRHLPYVLMMNAENITRWNIRSGLRRLVRRISAGANRAAS